MSRLVRQRLTLLGLDHVDHEFRSILDSLVEERTGKSCDQGVRELGDEEFKELYQRALHVYRKRRKRPEALAYA